MLIELILPLLVGSGSPQHGMPSCYGGRQWWESNVVGGGEEGGGGGHERRKGVMAARAGFL